LRQASETKSRFLSHMSHEFRTPLNSIRSLASMLASHLDGPLSAEQQRQVEYIRRGADALLEMVDDLLDLAKIEAGKVELNPAELTVAELFATLRGMFRPLITSDAVVLRFGDVSGIQSLCTDESKLSQIMRNLISNALKFTERGEVEVTAKALPDDRICIVVRDTGIGIPPEHLNSLFREFVQIMNPLQKSAKGTGLGLSLSQQLAVMLGGGIEVTSSVGEGSTFTVTFLRDLRPAPEQIHRPVEAPSRSLNETPVVLIVDDAEADRYALRILMPPSCEVLEASGGLAAMDHLARRLPDVVFLDLAMPDMSGYDLLTAIKSAPDTRDVRVIIHSSQKLTGELRADLLDRGAESIIEKGYTDIETMRRRVAEVIDCSDPAAHWKEH
ncbi:MAG TPA: hybrid sensor histidine kinase/response regulator, partial [Thermoanaerobaculia bacterium]